MNAEAVRKIGHHLYTHRYFTRSIVHTYLPHLLRHYKILVDNAASFRVLIIIKL
jgi:hypothetical protein